jgi:L,D-peptidoglycan transpeptidase YkuD (ErfK/YbiS/YcfS/YnhG family)
LARADYGETQGCIALALDDLTQALAQLRIEDRLVVRK